MQREFNAFPQQAEFLRSSARVIGAFASKRCITPDTSVLTPDGLKSFGNIRHGETLLSFSRKANEFRFSQSGAAFPKTKCSGYRVIHDRGEFVVSPHHLILLDHHGYLSCEEIIERRLLDSGEQSASLVSHQYSTSELARLLSSAGDLSFCQKYEGFLDRYGTDSRQCDRSLAHPMGQHHWLFQKTLGVLERLCSDAHHGVSLTLENLLGNLHGYTHPCLASGHRTNLHELDRGAFHYADLSDPSYENSAQQLFYLFQASRQSLVELGHLNIGRESARIPKDLSFDSCSSKLQAIEAVSSRWFWDVEVPGDNNYWANGAVHHNSGKTEVGAIKSLISAHTKLNFVDNGRDPYVGIIAAPTRDMLKKLSMAKFLGYAQPWVKDFNKTEQTVTLIDGQVVYGVSADRPQRAEGIRASFAWVDEVFQCSEQFFLEMQARVSDQRGQIFCTGSLGVQYVNPKNHWAYQYFKEQSLEGYHCLEWTTAQNPYFPQDELARLKNTLDPKTFRAMFEISWDSPAENAVYQIARENLMRGYVYDPDLPTFCTIDWGWNHFMACLFVQYNPENDTLYVFDEIVESRLTLDSLASRMRSKGYKIQEYWCDVSGKQTREQSGISNIDWFHKNHKIDFRFMKSEIGYGIAAVRAKLKDGAGRFKLKFDEVKCPKTIDHHKNYHYPVNDGRIVSELPVDKDQDACDALRYLIFGKFNTIRETQKMKSFNQMGGWV